MRSSSNRTSRTWSLPLLVVSVLVRADFPSVGIKPTRHVYDTGIPSPGGSRRPFSGEPEDIAGDIRNFAAIGVHELIFDCRGQSITESIERLQWFANDVIPVVDG